MNTVENTFTVPVTMEIPVSRIQDLLCSALEGGSDYWIERMSCEKTSVAKSEDLVQNDYTEFRHLAYPVSPQHFLRVTIEESFDDSNQVEFILSRSEIESGLKLMAAGKDKRGNIPMRHWENFISENDDAETGDVFLQLCLFGEIVFG